MKTDLRADLTAIGAIFTLIILLFNWSYQTHIFNKQIQLLQSNYLQAQHAVIYMDSRMSMLEDSRDSLNEYIEELLKERKDLGKLIQIKDELRNYSTEEQALALALGWTESSWNHQASHQGKYSNFCGNDPRFWDNFLLQKGINPNSAAACIEIYNFYKQANKGSRIEALKDYKGIEKNTHLASKVLILKSKILKILKEP